MYFPQLIDRRSALQAGSLGLLGLDLPGFLQLQSMQAALPDKVPIERKIRSCIFIFYYGGPSHIDTFDMKPNAPSEVRGEFKSITTSVPGLRICEYLPHTSRIMHKVALVRNMHHSLQPHNDAGYITLTGRAPLAGQALEGKPSDSFPCYGASLSYAWRNQPILVPHVLLPYVMLHHQQYPAQFAGFLGDRFQPLVVQGDPDQLTYGASLPHLRKGLTRDRLHNQEQLRRTFNRKAKWPENAPSMDVFHQRAFELLASDTVRQAFDVRQESEAMRSRYGYGPAVEPFQGKNKINRPDYAYANNLRGLNLLMARRLVEAGVPFINVNDYLTQGMNWDTHWNNFRDHKQHLLPAADQGFTALIEDLDERGLLDTTLVVAVGEFGRSPRINKDAGRDHWPDCYTAVIAGGGIKGGYIHGRSDKLGAYPDTIPVTPADLAATMFHRFGVNPGTVIRDTSGRPYPISEGQPVHELFT